MAHINRISPPTHDYTPQAVTAGSTSTPSAPPDTPHVRAPESGTMRGRLGNAPPGPSVQAQRKEQIRAERQKREKSLVDSASAREIRAHLDAVKSNPDAKVILFGYSPTGGGHTGRLLNILNESMEKHIHPGDIVVAHVPGIWNDRPRPAELTNLLQALTDKGAKVLMVEAEKSVQGFLREDGSSFDSAILGRFATMPKRPDAKLTSITQAKVFSKDTGVDNLETIDANHLLDSLSEHLGEETMGKVYVADDMDTALQKAAARYGVPGDQRISQQNHAILLEADPARSANNLQPNMGVLSKVLGGHGELVAHIGLGDKNTLQQMETTVRMAKLNASHSKQHALRTISDLFIKHANPVDVNELRSSQAGAGILRHGSLTDGSKVKNMLYVYANDNQREIARHIDAKIKNNDPHYTGTLFVFCGKGAFAEGPLAKANALHLAYLADADGITTAGAGTVGEFGYLHNKGGATSKFMAIPIEGHNEQEANGRFLENDPHLGQFVSVTESLHKKPLPNQVDSFMKISHANIEQKMTDKPIGTMLKAISDTDTYPAHGSKLLFGEERMTAQEARFAQIERDMNKETVLSANRHMQKLFFQTVETMAPVLKGETEESGINIVLRKGRDNMAFKSMHELADFLKKDAAMTFLADGKHIDPSDILLLNETRDLFSKMADRSLGSKKTLEAIDELGEKFGHQTTTGF